MPTQSTRLSEKEVQTACAFWVEKGCPKPDREYSVWLNVDRPPNANQFDPGEGVTATITPKP